MKFVGGDEFYTAFAVAKRIFALNLTVKVEVDAQPPPFFRSGVGVGRR